MNGYLVAFEAVALCKRYASKHYCTSPRPRVNSANDAKNTMSERAV